MASQDSCGCWHLGQQYTQPELPPKNHIFLEAQDLCVTQPGPVFGISNWTTSDFDQIPKLSRYHFCQDSSNSSPECVGWDTHHPGHFGMLSWQHPVLPEHVICQPHPLGPRSTLSATARHVTKGGITSGDHCPMLTWSPCFCNSLSRSTFKLLGILVTLHSSPSKAFYRPLLPHCPQDRGQAPRRIFQTFQEAASTSSCPSQLRASPPFYTSCPRSTGSCHSSVPHHHHTHPTHLSFPVSSISHHTSSAPGHIPVKAPC